ncbi:MAG: xanthine dehydrogenase family protein molybdopterin-binding subunit [Candidatus Binatia bacterium]
MATAALFGASVKRREDPRFLLGATTYTDDLKLPNTVTVAFVRSPYAHAKLKSIDASRALAHPGVLRVITGEETVKLAKPIQVRWGHGKPIFNYDFKACDFHALAVDKVRFVGDLVAAVVATDRYVAEDALELVDVEYEPLPAVVDPEEGMKPGAPLVHEEWGDNVRAHTVIENGDVERAFREADAIVKGRFQMNRHCAAPMENRAVLASYDAVENELTMWSSTQMPHMVRTKIAESLDFPESRLRVIGPDVGGGFGLKCHIFPEELVLCLLTKELRRPVKWAEDRRENLLGSYHAKDELCYAELAVKKDGTILGLRATFISDSGAYTSYPWTPALEPIQAAFAVTGPYKISNVRTEGIAVATNKTTSSVYRGVGLPASLYTMEHIIDLAASKIGMDPMEMRRKNILASSDFPYRQPTGPEIDSATPLESLDMALDKAGYAQFRKEQAAARAAGRYLGIGVSCMVEQSGFGTKFWHPLGVRSVAGYEAAHIRVDPNGGVTLGMGTFNHGQGHATVFPQLAAHVIGCDLKDVRFVQGDTEKTPYGWGTWGSRSAVSGGGAVLKCAERIRDKILRVAANMLECSTSDLEQVNGAIAVKGVPGRSVTLRQVAQAAVYTAEVPEGEEPGLEASYYYDPPAPFSNATHLAVVEVDPETGSVKVLRYIVVEDCGRMINPMIVEGQIAGGVAQGLGLAMLEHLQYDENGQILTTSLMDYLIPSSSDVPDIEYGHLETPSPISEGGIKGMGEGGAVAPPAALANAVADALSPLVGWRAVERLPMSPEIVRGLATK